MKRFFYLLFALPLALVACDPEPVLTPEVKDPVLTVAETSLDFKAEGGKGTITYTIENAVEGTNLIAICDAEWVTDIAVAEDVTFTVLANAGEARETKVIMAYGKLLHDVTIKQEAKVEEPDPEEPETPEQPEKPEPNPDLKEAHTIEVEQISWRDAVITFTPEDTTKEYVAGIFTREVYDAKFGEDKDAIIADRLAYWEATAKQYEDYGYDDPWQYYMQNEQRAEAQCVAASELMNLTWNSEYVVYCFGIDDDGTVTSKVTIEEIKTLAPESSDNSIEIVIDNTTETSISFTVKATNDDPYFVSLQQTAYTDCYGPDTDQPYEMMINDLVGTYPDNVLNEKFIHSGTQQFESSMFLSSVNSLREYKVIVCGFDNGPTTEVLLSEAIKPGTTASEEPLELSIEVKEVKATSIAFAVTPTINSRTYFAGLYTRAEVGADADAFAATLTPNELFTGYRDLNVEELTPETEYYALAFGYDAEKGELTTDVVLSDVITTPEQEPEPVVEEDFTISLTDITWHDVSIGITAKDSSAKYIVGIVSKADYTDKCNGTPEGIVELRKSEWMETAEMYKDWGYNDPWQYYMRDALKSGSRSFVGSQLCLMRWATDYVAYVFGMDNSGNLTSEVFVAEYTTLVPATSANSFEIAVNSTTTSSVNFTVTASNNDPYYVTVQQKGYVEVYGPDKEESYEDMIYNLTGEVADWLLQENIYNGTQTITISSLTANREYYIVVCGFENGPTTEIALSESFKAVAQN